MVCVNAVFALSNWRRSRTAAARGCGSERHQNKSEAARGRDYGWRRITAPSTGPIATLSAASARAENLATRIDIHFADIESGQLDFELEIDERLAVM